MSADTWLLFALTELALCISPGPAVLYVTSNALYRGFASSAVAALGIVTGNVVYFAASAFGVGALILAAGDAFVVVKWLGAACLVWIGLQMWRRRRSIEPGISASVPRARIYWGGVAVQLSNPKNLVFFIAILPPFIDTSSSVPLQVLILAVTSQVIEAAVLLAYGGAGSVARRRIADTRFSAWLDRAAGTLLIAIGVALALINQRAI